MSGCDGSRWISVTGPDSELTYSAPCPRCNPRLHHVFLHDTAGWKAILAGVPTRVVLGEDVEDYEIPACPVETWHEPAVPPQRGYDVAMAAYVQDCKERGIEVDVDKFHRVMGAFVGDRERRFLEPEQGRYRSNRRSSVLGSAAASPEGSDGPGTADRTPDR